MEGLSWTIWFHFKSHVHVEHTRWTDSSDFYTAIVVETDTKVHARFLNQISGPTLAKWQWRPILDSICGRMYQHMSIGPYRWSKSWGKPVFRPDTIIGPCESPGNIYIVSYSYHDDDLSWLCNRKRIMQYIKQRLWCFIQQNVPVPIVLVNTRCILCHCLVKGNRIMHWFIHCRRII